MAAAYDIVTRKIPNFIVGIIYITGIILNVWQQDWLYAAKSFGMCLFVCALLYPLFLSGSLGAGDIKLYSALPCFCNRGHILQLYLIVFCVGAVLGIGNMLFFISDVKSRSNHIVDIVASRISWQCKNNTKVLPTQNNTIPMALPFVIGIAVAIGLEISNIYSFF